jgi:hypothetical protein
VIRFGVNDPAGLLDRDHDPNVKCDADHDNFSVAVRSFVEELNEREKEKWLMHRKARTSYEELARSFDGFPKACPFEHGQHPIIVPSHNDHQQIVYHFDRADPEALGSARDRLGPARMVFQGHSLVYLPHAVRLINEEGMNDDHRGRNHMNIELDWHEEYVIPAGMHSVYDLVQSCFRIKGNKFENHYEMFCQIVDEEDVDPDNSESVDEWARVVSFDGVQWIVTPIINHWR